MNKRIMDKVKPQSSSSKVSSIPVSSSSTSKHVTTSTSGNISSKPVSASNTTTSSLSSSSSQFDIFSSLSKLKWSTESMNILQLIESLEMPQIVKIARSNFSDLKENDFLLLQSVYDRYIILGLAQSQSRSTQAFLIPDWYRAQCKIRSPNPRIQKQFWNFQGASEISRFDLPREINFLAETPLYQYQNGTSAHTEWKRVVLKRNSRLTVTKLQTYMLENTNKSSCFVLVDRRGSKYLLPSEFNVKFSVEIKKDEYNSSYFDHKGVFTLPEIITRYEFPIDIEFVTSNEAGSVPASKLPRTPFKLVSVAIAKSLIGSVYNMSSKKTRYFELSPAAHLKLSIPK